MINVIVFLVSIIILGMIVFSVKNIKIDIILVTCLLLINLMHFVFSKEIKDTSLELSNVSSDYNLLLDSYSVLLNDKYKDQKAHFISVRCTMYNPVINQTDNTPDVTYSNRKIDIDIASGYRYVAISRDLLRMGYKMGDFIYVTGLNDYYNGVWEIQDVMHRKWTRKIDFLQSEGSLPPPNRNCFITKINKPILNGFSNIRNSDVELQ